MRLRLGLVAATTAAFACALAPVAQACTPANRAALLIMDLSDSMTARVPSGEMRVDIARNAVQEVVEVFPPEGQLALRVYGSETPSAQMDCKDSRLLVPFATAGENKQAIIDACKETLDAVMIVSEPFTVAYGMERMSDILVIDIGAGTSDLCRMHGTVPSEEDEISITVAGDAPIVQTTSSEVSTTIVR